MVDCLNQWWSGKLGREGKEDIDVIDVGLQREGCMFILKGCFYFFF